MTVLLYCIAMDNYVTTGESKGLYLRHLFKGKTECRRCGANVLDVKAAQLEFRKKWL